MQVGRPERTGPLTVWDLLGDDVQAGPAVQDVEAGPAVEHVVAGATKQRVVAGAALQHVVTGATVGGKCDRASSQSGGVDRIVARLAVDGQRVARIGAADVSRRLQASFSAAWAATKSAA